MESLNNKQASAKVAMDNRGLGYYGGILGMSSNIFSYPVPCFDHVIYINDLEYLEDHQDRLQVIRMATPDDNIRIIINSPGGAIHIAMAYISAITESPASIVTHAEGMVCSAGTLLWLASKERTISPMTEFMFHNYQGYTYGNGANMHSQVTFYKDYFNRVMKRFYQDVLTEEEISRISNGGEVYLDDIEISKRTQAQVLTTQYLDQCKSMFRGIPDGNVCDQNLPDMEEKQNKPYISLSVGNESRKLFFDEINEETLSDFGNRELYSVLQQFNTFCKSYGIEKDLSEISTKSKRETLIKALQDLAEEALKAF